MNRTQFRESMIVLVTAVVFLLPLAALGFYVFHKHQWAEGRLAELTPRYARLQGLDLQKTDIEGVLARAQEAMGRYVYPEDQDVNQAGNAAQQRLREIFAAANLQVSSSQVLPAKAEKGFDRIPLQVRAESDQLALQSALAVLSGQAPVMALADMDIQVIAPGMMPPGQSPRLSVQFLFHVFRVHP